MFNFFGLQIHLYGLIIGLAIWIAIEIFERLLRKYKIPRKFLDGLYLFSILGGIAGARLYHVIDFWERYYSREWIKILFIWEGGLGIWGAIVGGVISILIYGYFYNIKNKNSRVNLLFVLDRITVVLPLSQMIGRLGNWVNGELVGKNGEPLFLYEGVLNLALFLVLIYLINKKDRPGMTLGVYLVGYGLIRFLLENLRPDQVIWRVGNIPTAIIFSTVAIFLGIVLIFEALQKRNSS